MVAAEGNRDPARVLVVDDDDDVRAVTMAALEECGFEVLEAKNGHTALAILEAGTPVDLIVTDVVMPGISGFHVARGAEQRRPGIKILLLSAYADALVDAELPAERFLPKPFRIGELTRRVASLLDE
jgi:CheY-like chemotaxis protein